MSAPTSHEVGIATAYLQASRGGGSHGRPSHILPPAYSHPHAHSHSLSEDDSHLPPPFRRSARASSRVSYTSAEHAPTPTPAPAPVAPNPTGVAPGLESMSTYNTGYPDTYKDDPNRYTHDGDGDGDASPTHARASVELPTSPISRAHALARGRAAPAPTGGFFPLPDPSKTHPENTTVFVGGLPGTVVREELGALFAAFGEVTYINVPPGKGCGFVSFDTRQSAELAIERMQGFWLRGAQLRLAWGRVQAGDKPKQASLAASVKQDLPFFTSMLELSGEQQVRLGLFLEFAGTGSLSRLKDIMANAAPIFKDNTIPTPTTTTAAAPDSLGLTFKPQVQVAPTPNVRVQHTQPAVPYYAVNDDVSQHHVSALVDSPPPPSPPGTVSPPSFYSRGDSLSTLSSAPLASLPSTHAHAYAQAEGHFGGGAGVSAHGHGHGHVHEYAESVRSRGQSSISDEAVFRAFHPTMATAPASSVAGSRAGAQKSTGPSGTLSAPHRHSENCVTPSSLQKLQQQQQQLGGPFGIGHKNDAFLGIAGAGAAIARPGTGIAPTQPRSQRREGVGLSLGHKMDQLSLRDDAQVQNPGPGLGLDAAAQEWVPPRTGGAAWMGSGAVYGASGW